MRVEDYIAKHAEESADKVAVIDCDGKRSYSEFHSGLLSHAGEIRRRRVRVVPFRMRQLYESLLTYFASHIAGCVAVPLERGCPQQPFADISQWLLRGDFVAGTADVLFTTGITGCPKGVMISHSAIVSEAENLVEAQGYTSDLTFIISGPLNHIGSLSKLYPSFMVGATVHILDGLHDMNAFFDAIERAETKVATFLVPASLRMLVAFGADRLRACADKIDFIETGAAPMAEADMRKLCSLLPHTRLYNTYASTEAGIVATHNFNGGVCVAGCLGKPMKNSSVGISPDGFVVCGGRTLMSGYWNDEPRTCEVMRDGLLYTRDLGIIDKDGRLHLQGRVDDVINAGGYKIAPTEVESEAMCVPGIKDCVCVATSHPILGRVIKLIVVPENDRCPTFKEIAARLRRTLVAYKIPQLYQYADHVERTYNGKIDRKAYREDSPFATTSEERRE